MDDKQRTRIRMAFLIIFALAIVGTGYGVWHVPLTPLYMAALAMVLLLALLAAYAVIAMFGISPQPPTLGRIPTLVKTLQFYCAIGAPMIHALASVVLTVTLYDAQNVPLTICLDIYLIVSAINLLAFAAAIVLWEWQGKRLRKRYPNFRGPSHN